jgi:hypothetical protein
MPAKAPRYKVEAIGPRFALIDWETGDLKHCPSGTTRGQADRECDALNGTGFARAPRDAPSHERKFRGALVTFEEIEECDRRSKAMGHPVGGPLDPDIYGHLRMARLQMEQQKKREMIAAVEAWLPGALTDWGAKVAEGHGYGGERREAWPTDEILCLQSDAIEDVLLAHFVSVEPSHIKARFFGIEKRAYLNRVKTAIQRLARVYVRRLADNAALVGSLSKGLMTFGIKDWAEWLESEERWEGARRKSTPTRSGRIPRKPADKMYEARISAQRASAGERTFPPDQPRNGVTQRKRHDY